MSHANILIVDDEIIIARELESRLRSMGYEVAAIASSGAEAIRLAVEMSPDLVLMDIVLKGDIDGIEAASEIRRLRQIPIVYVTAYTDRTTLERASITEPYGYIVKPFTEQELDANIQMALYKHRTESRLRKVERWFHMASETITDAVIMTDRERIITFINTTAEEITGWERHDAVGRPLEEVFRLVGKEDDEPVSFAFVDEGPVVCLASETMLIDRAGRRLPVDSSTSCIRDGDDNRTGTVSVFRDVVGRRHGALVALNADLVVAAAQAMNLRGMLQLCAQSLVRNTEAALVRIWTLGSTGQVLQLQASAGLYDEIDGPYGRIPVGSYTIGAIARERTPYFITDLQNHEDAGQQEWARQEGMTDFAGYPLMVDERIVGVLAMVAPRPFSPYFLEAFESVVHAIALGIERKHLEEQLRQSQKMEAIGRLAGGVAHDFNNLLTVISGYAQLLLRRDLGKETLFLVQQIAVAGERAASLTHQLLAFSRKQVLEPKVINLNALVAGMEEMLQRLIGEGIALAASLDPALAQMLADPGQIEQVVMNLVINAVDAMPDGGKLTIETRNVELDENYAITHTLVRPGEYILLAISDTGQGIAPELVGHIFEPFFTTKGAGKGTGLGLATVYGIVRQSGGYIEIYSEPGLGTTLKVYLPSTNRESSVAKPADQQTMPVGSETILLVEDGEEVRVLSRYILEECGYKVLEAKDGGSALRLVEKYEGPIHLLLTDVVLPELNGRLLAERLVPICPGLRVIFMSGYTEDAVIRNGVLQSRTDFLQKPFVPTGLARKVREVLDRPVSDAGPE
jgi:PAS domain S-box-containing protein